LPCVPAITTERFDSRNSGRRQHLDVILPANVADDDRVGTPIEVRRPEALEASDVLLLQLRRHRRVDVLVRAAHVVARGLQQTGEGAHAGAADADEMNLHFGTHSLA
jgi:hypothetical protein